MKVTKKQYTNIQLEMTEDQAQWLRGYMQNNMTGTSEDYETRDNRAALFDALTNALPERSRGGGA